jgi:hypothetical protein
MHNDNFQGNDFKASFIDSLNQTFRTLVFLFESSAKLELMVNELQVSLKLNPLDLGLFLSKADTIIDSSNLENFISTNIIPSLFKGKEFYLIHSIGILFEPILNLSVNDFLLSLSKRKPVVLLLWGSELDDKIHLYNDETDMVLSIKTKQIINL